MASIGNEIRNGMLWPVGQLDWTADTGWDNLATLLKAGVAGARAANPPHHQLRVMLRFDRGGSNADSTRFFGNLISRGVDFDVIGLSYYTFWHGPVTALRSNVNALATSLGKDIVIAEMQYAWTLANGNTTGNFVWQAASSNAATRAPQAGSCRWPTTCCQSWRMCGRARQGILLLGARVGARGGLGARRPHAERRTTSRGGRCLQSASLRTQWPCARATTATAFGA
jgi:Glycosyl hydrolase family 53